MAKILTMDNSGEFVLPLHVSLGFDTKLTRIVVTKIFAISLSSQPFLGCHLGLHTFYNCLLWNRILFFSWAVLDYIDFYYKQHKEAC